MSDFVYFMQAGGAHGAIKIGHSHNAERRLEQLRTGNHLPVEMLAKFIRADAPFVERQLHAVFAHLRLEGEWFRFDQVLVDLIDAWALSEAKSRGEFSPARVDTIVTSVRRSDTRKSIGDNDWWVVQWSESRGRCDTLPMIESLAMIHQLLFYGRDGSVERDSVTVAIAVDMDEAAVFAKQIEPWLRARQILRKFGLELPVDYTVEHWMEQTL